ncbi:MAG: PKD domain-containing protein [Bacteroidota bacterium]
MKNKLINNQSTLLGGLFLLAVLFSVGCHKAFEFELPESNSIPDVDFPIANFSYASTADDFRTIKFNNLSFESANFTWDFGNGNSSTEQDPTFTFEAGEGTYPVTLTAADGNGVTDKITVQVEVKEGPFQPIIVEAGFEDNTLLDGSGDGRDSWRNNTLGGVIQITGSPVTFGDQGAKLPSDQSRIGYQEIIVEPETNYDLRFYYTMVAGSSDPSLVVSVLGVTESGPYASREEAIAGAIGSVTVTNDEVPEEYIETKLSFNSGQNDIVAIFFYNGAVEARLDNFTIEVGAEGAVPPSPGFDVAQSEENYLEYSFTNTSINAESYEWDFGDGNMSTEVSPTHTYADANTYTVTLTTTGASNQTASLSKDIDIQASVTVGCSWEVDPEDYRTVHFADASEGAVELLWEFGDGFQFTGMSASHTYRDDGIYTVTLTATSITGLQDAKEFDVTISQGFIATISEGSFEDDDPSGAACGSALDGRDCWRNSALGGVIQITSGPTVTGSQAAKLPSDGSRIGYQRVMVEPNKRYTVFFNYTMKTSPEGSLTVSILDGSTLSDISQVSDATLASVTVNDQVDANAYIRESVSFNSGGRSEVAIFFTNTGVETRLDDFSIEEVELPMVMEGGFEDNSLSDGTGDGRDSWRNDALGGVIQITSSPVASGSQAAKLPSGGDRIGYQLVPVAPNTSYNLSFAYTMKTSPEGSLTVSVLDGRLLNDISEVGAATINSISVNDQTDANAYITENLMFNSGDNSEIAIFFSNSGVEARIDDISLTASAAFIPMIGEFGFEDNSLPDGTGDGRDSWRNDLGGVIQITSSPVNSGSQAAKMPSGGDRVGYQQIAVEPNTKYRVSFFYTMKDNNEGSLTVSILDGSMVTDLSQVPAATITSITVDDKTDPSTYIMESMEFSSGNNSVIGILFTNEGVECRVDDFSITTL